MELIGPENFRLDEATTAMLGDVDELARQVNEIRPLSLEVLEQVKEELFGERVFSSNAIEGNTLTLRETRLVLQTKTFLDGRRRRDAQEALNLGEASRRVEQILEAESDWHEITNFLAVHEILMTGVNDSIAGVIRNRDVIITGARHQPPGSREASDLVDSVFHSLATTENVHGLVLAVWVHWAIARVHPFEDGNGRMARLWQDLILLRSRLTVAIIRPQDRQAYLDALALADENDFNPLTQLVCQRVMSTLQTYLNAQQAADELQGWAAGLVGETSVRESERCRLAYQRWHHAVEQLRDSFERCAGLINSGANPSLEAQLHQYEIIDQPTWETLLSGGVAKRTWFFSIRFRNNHKMIWYYFLFGRHFWSQADEAIGEDGPWVNIMVSQQYPNESKAIRLDDAETTHVSLRELLVIEKRTVRRRWDTNISRAVYDLNKKPIEIAKEFFEEVLLKELV